MKVTARDGEAYIGRLISFEQLVIVRYGAGDWRFDHDEIAAISLRYKDPTPPADAPSRRPSLAFPE